VRALAGERGELRAHGVGELRRTEGGGVGRHDRRVAVRRRRREAAREFDGAADRVGLDQRERRHVARVVVAAEGGWRLQAGEADGHAGHGDLHRVGEPADDVGVLRVDEVEPEAERTQVARQFDVAEFAPTDLVDGRRHDDVERREVRAERVVDRVEPAETLRREGAEGDEAVGAAAGVERRVVPRRRGLVGERDEAQRRPAHALGLGDRASDRGLDRAGRGEARRAHQHGGIAGLLVGGPNRREGVVAQFEQALADRLVEVVAEALAEHGRGIDAAAELHRRVAGLRRGGCAPGGVAAPQHPLEADRRRGGRRVLGRRRRERAERAERNGEATRGGGAHSMP
jgi:hypothetical protein